MKKVLGVFVGGGSCGGSCGGHAWVVWGSCVCVCGGSWGVVCVWAGRVRVVGGRGCAFLKKEGLGTTTDRLGTVLSNICRAPPIRVIRVIRIIRVIRAIRAIRVILSTFCGPPPSPPIRRGCRGCDVQGRRGRASATHQRQAPTSTQRTGGRGEGAPPPIRRADATGSGAGDICQTTGEGGRWEAGRRKREGGMEREGRREGGRDGVIGE